MTSESSQADSTEPRSSQLPTDVLQAEDPLFVAMGLPDDPAQVQQILKERHESLVDDCMAEHGIDAYEPETGGNSDGHVNVDISNGLTIAERQAWIAAYSGSGDRSEPGCADQFNELVYPLAGLPDLASFLEGIGDDERFLEAGAEYDDCMSEYPPDTNGVVDFEGSRTCGAPLDEVRRLVYREYVLAYLEDHFDEVVSFGQKGAQL